MNVTINILELASELAERDLLEQAYFDVYAKDENGDTYYTEEAQDLFDQLYDEYYALIEKCKI